MPSTPNHWLKTPRRRLAFVLAVGSLTIFVLLKSAGTVWLLRIFGLGVACYGLVQVRRFWKAWNGVRKGVRRWEMRVVKSWREFARYSPFVQALHVLGFALGLLWTSIVVGLQADAEPVYWAAVIVLGIAGVCEITVQMGRIVRKAWAPLLGKIIAVSFGVALAALALSSAKQLAHAISPIDTKYMSEFTAIVAALYLPFMYLAAAGVAMAVYALFQVFVFWVVSSAGMIAENLRPFLGEHNNMRLRMYWYRIRCGKRPPGGVLPPMTSFPPSEISLFVSPISKVIVATVLVGGVQEVTKFLPHALPFLTRTMVEVEYRQNSGCRGLPRGARVVYMDDGNISIAEVKGNSFTFRVGACNY